MPVRQIQSVFTLGELDPRLKARADFEGYFKGADKLRDVLTIPQGGVTRRFGTDYVATIVDTGDSDEPITDATEVNGISFSYNSEKDFVIIARPNDRTGTPGVAFNIYLDGALKDTVTTTDYSISQIKDLYFVAATSRVIILHKDVQPHELVRATDTSWSLSAITFAYKPTYDFSIIDGVSYRGSSDTFTPSATSGSGKTLTGSSAFFDAGHVGGIFIGGGGIFRITSVNTGGTVATGDILDDFGSTSAIKGVNSLLLSSAWGDFTGGTPAGKDRGWPSKGTFFQNRLILANTPQLEKLLFFSSSGDFYNFDDSEANDINAFSYSTLDAVQDVVGNKGLIALTSSTIEATSIFIDAPLTASNVFITPQSFYGSDNVYAQVVDNQVIFVDANGQQVNSAVYDINGGFLVSDASILSPQLVNAPTSTASFRPSSNSGEFFLLTNSDGTMSALQSLSAQKIVAWTLLRTQGDFKRVLSSGRTGSVVARRKVNTGATIAGDLDNVFTANGDFDNVTDITDAAASSSADVNIFAADSDYLILGSEAPFDKIDVVLDTSASSTITPIFQYLDTNGAWVTFTPTDNTSGFTTNGTITWSFSDVSSWYPQNFTKTLTDDVISEPLKKFWLRIQRTKDSLTTNPIEESIKINTADRLYLETLNFDSYMDSQEDTTSNSSGVVTGLDHLKGQMVFARVDTSPEGPFFVDSSGEITVSTESTDVKVGINYYPEISPMPIVAQFAFSQSVYQPKHIKSIYVDYYKTLGILVNGQEVQGFKLGSTVLDAKPVPESDFKEVTPMRGWNPRGTNTISQNLPLPMTLIGIGYRLEAN